MFTKLSPVLSVVPSRALVDVDVLRVVAVSQVAGEASTHQLLRLLASLVDDVLDVVVDEEAFALAAVVEEASPLVAVDVVAAASPLLPLGHAAAVAEVEAVAASPLLLLEHADVVAEVVAVANRLSGLRAVVVVDVAEVQLPLVADVAAVAVAVEVLHPSLVDREVAVEVAVDAAVVAVVSLPRPLLQDPVDEAAVEVAVAPNRLSGL